VSGVGPALGANRAMPDSRKATLKVVRELLESQTTASLATQGPDGPWVAAVFFAATPDFRLLFLSAPTSRHCRDLAAQPDVAVEVHQHAQDWASIRGLQLTGRVDIQAGADREAGLRRYLRKFPDVARMAQAPKGSDERVIAGRLSSATLYSFTPRWMRLIDNSREFGFKEEVTLPGVSR
jgi:uncharacterized protein YhbP (UPF0306 family)